MMDKEEMKLKKSTPSSGNSLAFFRGICYTKCHLKKTGDEIGAAPGKELVQRMRSHLSKQLSKCTRFAGLSLTEKKKSLN